MSLPQNRNNQKAKSAKSPLISVSQRQPLAQITHSYNQIVHLTSNALIVAVQDSCRGSFRLVRANLKCDPIDAEF
jgi:hypothetical protein